MTRPAARSAKHSAKPAPTKRCCCEDCGKAVESLRHSSELKVRCEECAAAFDETFTQEHPTGQVQRRRHDE